MQQETLSRRLALVRPEAAERATVESRPEESAWWVAHAAVPAWSEAEPGEGMSPEAPGAPEVSVVPVPVPTPGRHASRRPWVLLPRLPDALAGRTRLGPPQLTVVALVVAVALALTCWWLARGRPTDLTPVSGPTMAASPLVPLTATGGGVTTAPVPAPSGAPAAMVTVDVEGKVRRPGIVIVPTGSRVTDALKAAGGVRRRGSMRGLNLAAVLTDGQQIVVGAPTAVAPGVATGAGGSSASAEGALVNLNTATADELDTLPGVGPVTAQSILEWREQNGGFTSVQELLEVDGIGPATLAKLTPHVTV